LLRPPANSRPPAGEIAATTTEIGATSKEISATSKELVKTMGEVSAGAEQSATLAGSGQAGLSRMEETMRHIMDAAGTINTKLVVLNEKAGNINQVVTTITKVADQTICSRSTPPSSPRKPANTAAVSRRRDGNPPPR